MSSRLRVAYLLEQAWHPVPGGTAVAAVRTAEALAARDDVDLVGLTARHAGPETAPEIAAVPPGLEVVASALPRPVLYESWHRMRRPNVDRIAGRPDVVHASGGAVPATRRPLVATVHDLAWRRFPDVATRRGRRLFEAWLADARRADVVLCPSEATARDLEEAGVDDSAIRVVPLGVSASEVPREAVDALRRRHDIDRPFVLWLGTVEPRKNLGILVEAMRLAPGLVDVPLVLVGPSGWSEDVDRLVAPLSGRVRVVGAVPSSERDLWLAAATVLCLPSLHEGFGLPALEAMAHGTPVVASADTAIAEVVADAGLLADPADAGDVGEALAAVLGDASLASRLGSAGRERAAGYTWAATANETVAAYRDAMARWDR